ncbi:unnamed protein product, partial [Effrenium voratum]
AEFGPFLVQKLADGLREPPQLQLALGELDFVALLGSGQNAQHAVVLKMLEAALRLRAGLKAAAGNVFRALALQNASEHPKAWPTLLALQSLEVDDLLEKDSKEKDSKQKERAKARSAKHRTRREDCGGCQLPGPRSWRCSCVSPRTRSRPSRRACPRCCGPSCCWRWRRRPKRHESWRPL